MIKNKQKPNGEFIIQDHKEVYGESLTHSSLRPPTQPPEPKVNTPKQ